MRHVFALGGALALLLLASSARAHFIWATLEPDGKKIRLECAESPGESVAPVLEQKLASIEARDLGAFTVEKDHLHLLAPLAPNRTAGGIHLLYGVHGNLLIHWSAKGAADLKAAGKPIGLPLEILLRSSPKGLVAVVTKEGKPVSGADLEAYLPGQKAAMKAKTGADGTVSLPKAKSGLLAIGAIAAEPGAGDFHGTHYDETRQMGTLTVRLK
jgi:hypothetical protein